MAHPRVSIMDHHRQSLNPASAARSSQRFSMLRPARPKQVREARNMQENVRTKANKLGLTPPPYTFIELTGRGSYGRVFKSAKKDSPDILVAVKIVDVDRSDYEANFQQKDAAIQDLMRENQILQSLKDSQAKNINMIHEAFMFSSQFWIITDWCSGGSLNTLMKACNPPGLEEKHIIPLARELAIALTHIHAQNLVHRDIKAANILITRTGELQVCDFGVSGILETQQSKRTTVIGTPNWMPPEMHMGGDETHPGFATEVDIWAYGCTIYELADGRPPNAGIKPEHLPLFLQKAPKLEGERYSEHLKDFVAFCLEVDPKKRPSAHGILTHPFIANSETKYPTSSLMELLYRFAEWESKGGERLSLFNGFGAMATSSKTNNPTAFQQDDQDFWDFSEEEEEELEYVEEEEEETLATQEDRLNADSAKRRGLNRAATTGAITQYAQVNRDSGAELRAGRGGRNLGRLFDPEGEEYEYEAQSEPDSGLALRDMYIGSQADVRESVIDLDDAIDLGGDDQEDLQLPDVTTIRASKNQWLLAGDGDDEDDDDDDEEDFYNGNDYNGEKRATKDWTFPMRTTPAEAARPKTQDWSMASAMSAMRNKSEADVTARESLPAVEEQPEIVSPERQSHSHMASAPSDEIYHSMARDPSMDLDAPDRSSALMSDPDGIDADYSQISTSFSSIGASPFSELSMAESPDGHEKSAMGQRLSMHIHSHSEPKPDRKSQLAESPPRWDDEGHRSSRPTSRPSKSLDDTYAEPNLSRAPSVQASMGSIRHVSDDEDEGLSMNINRTARRPPDNLDREWSFQIAQKEHQVPVPTTRSKYSTTRQPSLADPFQPVNQDLREWQQQSRKLSRGRAPPLNEFDPSGKGHVGAVTTYHKPIIPDFPDIHPSNSNVLDDDTSAEDVEIEMNRLLDEFTTSLKMVSNILEVDMNGGRR